MKRLLRVQAPHFTAGIVVDGERVVEAAPILRWCYRHPLPWLLKYFQHKGWTAEVCGVVSSV